MRGKGLPFSWTRYYFKRDTLCKYRFSDCATFHMVGSHLLRIIRSCVKDIPYHVQVILLQFVDVRFINEQAAERVIATINGFVCLISS